MKLNVSLNLRVFVRASMRKKRADGEEEGDDPNQKHHYTYSELESPSDLSFTKGRKTWDADCPGDPGVKRGCVDSIPAQGTETPYAARCSQTKKAWDAAYAHCPSRAQMT